MSEASIFTLASVDWLVWGASTSVFRRLGAFQGFALAPMPTLLDACLHVLGDTDAQWVMVVIF